jgi:hypothetical protein
MCVIVRAAADEAAEQGDRDEGTTRRDHRRRIA